jgi:hypothetical protein
MLNHAPVSSPIRAQAERLAAENRVFDMEAELENERIVQPQEVCPFQISPTLVCQSMTY